MSRSSPRAAGGSTTWRTVTGGVIVAAVAVLLFAVLRPDADEAATAPAPAAPATGPTGQRAVAATATQLRALPALVDHPVYWVGPEPGTTYELTRTADGQVYIRYLTGGARPGDTRRRFVTVGTYPVDDPRKTVAEAAERADALTLRLPGSQERAVATRARPTSWYLADSDGGQLVEVYAARRDEARQLLLSGRVTRVSG